MIDVSNLFKSRSSGNSKAVAAGLISAAAAAGLTYFLYGTEKGAEKREHIKSKVRDVKDKIAGRAGELGDVSKEIFGDMASLLKEKADTIKNIDKKEISDLGDRIRSHWEEIKEDIEDTIDKAAEKVEEDPE